MSAFSVFTDRKRKKKNTQTPTVEQYYQGKARRLSQVRYTCLLVTVLFLVYGFAAHGEELTADNFRYMLKFLDLTAAEEEETSNEVRFDYASDNIGGIYRGDVVVLNKDGLSVYGWDADRLYSERFRMEDPRLTVTDKNIFAYDLGGNEVRVFNSYSQIARLGMQYPVYGFSACKAGSFAVITSEKNYRSAVVVYDENVRQIYKRLFSDTYVDQISLSPDGTHFLMLGHTAKNGDLLTLLEVYSVKDEAPVYSTSFTGELVLRVGYLTDTEYAVLTGDALRICGADPEQMQTVSLKNRPLTGCEFSDGYVLLTFSSEGLSDGTLLELYDRTASLVRSESYSGALQQKLVKGDTLHVLALGDLHRLQLPDGEQTVTQIGKDTLQLLFDTDGKLILFEKGRALRLQEETP